MSGASRGDLGRLQIVTYRTALVALAALAALSACRRDVEPAPDPKALAEFIARIEAEDRAARAAAIVEARRQEQKRIEASERRLDRYRTAAERALASPTNAEGVVKALPGG